MAGLVVPGALLACGDRPEPLAVDGTGVTGYAVVQTPTQLESDVEHTPIERTVPLEQFLAVTKRIGPAGGEVLMPQAGLRVVIPRGALRETVAITVTAAPGRALLYDFQPSGLEFLLPVRIEQDLRVTNAYANDAIVDNLLGAGFPESIEAAVAKDRVTTTSLYTVYMDYARIWASVFKRRFSGYMMISA